MQPTFFRCEADPGSEAPELQLTCLIKERIAAIQEQITELYYALNHVPHPCLEAVVCPARVPFRPNRSIMGAFAHHACRERTNGRPMPWT